MSNSALLAIIAALVLALVSAHWVRLVTIFATLGLRLDRWIHSTFVLLLYAALFVIYGVVLVYLLRRSVGTPEPLQSRVQYALFPHRGPNGVNKLVLRAVDGDGGGLEASATHRALQSPWNRAGAISEWNGFPDGNFHYEFTRQEYEDTFHLAVHWAHIRTSSKPGSPDAMTLDKGPLTRFRCSGALKCGTKGCLVVIKPGADVPRQCLVRCLCGAVLHHALCAATWSVNAYAAGAFWEHQGNHSHAAYTHHLPIGSHDTGRIQPLLLRRSVSLGESRLEAGIHTLPAPALFSPNAPTRAQSAPPSPQRIRRSAPPQPKVQRVERIADAEGPSRTGLGPRRSKYPDIIEEEEDEELTDLERITSWASNNKKDDSEFVDSDAEMEDDPDADASS
ncbi:hypothetical protein HMN09_00789900 [Mycena chlorophos]|uniref:Uncharacterized protein n=1 Tax=Mycena chlorophos TaxID=658473 RepID=A0A8H6SV34_MYCCL|nr:hypothetical protein HMN09_00789900 [Mycena chlorophos]